MPPGAGGEYDDIAEPEPQNQEFGQQQQQQQTEEAQYQEYNQQEYYQQEYNQYQGYHQVLIEGCTLIILIVLFFLRLHKKVAPLLHQENLLLLETQPPLEMTMIADHQVFSSSFQLHIVTYFMYHFPGED